jgi:hypothetical protein
VAAEAEEAFAAEAFAVAAVASVVASMAAGVMAEVMASTVAVRAAGGTSTAFASAGGDIGPIALA